MKLYVSGRLYFLQNKPDLRWAMQSYEDTALSTLQLAWHRLTSKVSWNIDLYHTERTKTRKYTGTLTLVSKHYTVDPCLVTYSTKWP